MMLALEECQRFNIVHRDITPSNMMLDKEKKVLKIGDFGKAKVIDPSKVE